MVGSDCKAGITKRWGDGDELAGVAIAGHLSEGRPGGATGGGGQVG